MDTPVWKSAEGLSQMQKSKLEIAKENGMGKNKHHAFNTDDALKYGIVEAVLLYNFRYWLDHNKANEKNKHEGFYWTYNSYSALHQLFEYIPAGTIRKKIQSLEKKGLLVSSQKLNKAQYDRTKWYTIPKEYAYVSEDASTDPTGQCRDSGGQCRDSGGQPIPDINTDINKNNPPTPQGDGFLRADQLAPEKEPLVRKPSPRKSAKHDPHARIIIRHNERNHTFNTLEEQVEAVIEVYRKLKPHDQTRSRAKTNIRKILETGTYSVYQLMLAVERYGALSQPEWCGQSKISDYVNEKAWIEDEYLKGVGNFFGKEKLFVPFCKRGYKADIEEVDWKFFGQEYDHIGDCFEKAKKKPKYTIEYVWNHNTALERWTIRYGYTPAQLAGPYDRRFQ
jgi:hypothetical protein